MNKIVTFNESHIGTVSSTAWEEKVASAGLTAENFTVVDNLRETYIAEIGKEVLAYADQNSLGDGSGTGCSVSEISLGGNAIANVVFTQGGEFRMEVTHRYDGDLMKEVQSQAETLWQKFNVTEG